ncbi:MAG: ABC-type multidrug transport system ATPase subunit [Salibacteraceae bacterium]|mgnify:FL=1|jgi:ABC-type multidrug transport system ATPase subunit|tara:strand:+ start:7817 stop:8461 length:645 start_codon:yes stop_codon:yes gene_type:complete
MDRLFLNQVSKRFQTHWVFKSIDLELSVGESLFINGPNGSGKSTLLKIISGWVSPNEGNIKYYHNENEILVDNVFEYISISAPYLELIEELSLTELLKFHQSFKQLSINTTANEFSEAIEIEHQISKPIKSYSSGMKQRVKLGLTLFSNSSLILLDEPTSNLDKSGILWYKKNIETILKNRIVIVCSNDIADEHFFCTKKINLSDYKHHKKLDL